MKRRIIRYFIYATTVILFSTIFFVMNSTIVCKEAKNLLDSNLLKSNSNLRSNKAEDETNNTNNNTDNKPNTTDKHNNNQAKNDASSASNKPTETVSSKTDNKDINKSNNDTKKTENKETSKPSTKANDTIKQDTNKSSTNSNVALSDADSKNLGLSSDVIAKINEVLELVNKERKANGLTPFTTNEGLTKCATIRSGELPTLFEHKRPDGRSCFSVLDENKVPHSTCGENIAAGYSSPKAVVDGWMNSPGHRANILNGNFHKMGVGLVISSKGYKYFWTQVFTN